MLLKRVGSTPRVERNLYLCLFLLYLARVVMPPPPWGCALAPTCTQARSAGHPHRPSRKASYLLLHPRKLLRAVLACLDAYRTA